jgi:hypothetical protein
MAFWAFQLKKMIDGVPGNAVNTNKHIGFMSSNIVSVDVASYPLSTPEEGEESFSYENHLFLECVGEGPTKAWDFEFLGPNLPVSGQPDDPECVCMAGATSTLYTPVGSESTVATVRQDNNYYSPDDPNNLDIPCNPGDNQIEVIGERTEILVLQYKLLFGCPQGNLPRWYGTFRFKSN